MALLKRGKVYWYHLPFAGKHTQESTRTGSKTLARAAEQAPRRDLEHGFNSVADTRKEPVRSAAELVSDYLEDHKLRHRSASFTEYALEHVTRHVGSLMLVDASEQVILDYHSTRLKEEAAPRTIKEEVGSSYACLKTREMPFANKYDVTSSSR